MIILWIYAVICEVDNFVTNDIIYIEPYFKFGYATVEVINEELYKRGGRECDLIPYFSIISIWIDPPCDFSIYHRLCYFHQDLSNELLEHSMTFLTPTIKVTIDDVIYSTHRRYLKCTESFDYYHFHKNRDINNFRVVLTTYSGLFSMYLHLTSVVVERGFDADLWRGIQFRRFPFCYNLVVAHITNGQRYQFRFRKYIQYIYGYVYQNGYIKATCYPDYFGMDCWYQCKTTSRMFCQCIGISDYVNLICNIYCKTGWLNLYASYKLRYHRELLPYCEVINRCELSYANTCKGSELCLPIDNNTIACVELIFDFVSQWETINITSDVFFKNELITIKIDYSLVQNKDVLKNSSFVNDVRDLYANHIVLDQGNNIFQIIGDFTEYLYEFDLRYIFTDWKDKYIQRYRKFKIYETPSDVDMYNELDQSITDYIYLNETISCNSSAKPIYKSMTYWTFSCCINTFPVTNRFTIAITSLTKYTRIACYITMFAYNRSTFASHANKIVFIKIFKYFGWNSMANVLQSTSFVLCEAKAFIEFHLKIIQIEGFSMVPIVNLSLNLTDASGGTYVFICMLNTKLIYNFIKTMIFELRTNPEFVCLFFYPPVAGYIIQCGHNGHIPDEYSIEVSLYIWKATYYDLYNARELYVRLPYTGDIIYFNVICNVSSNVEGSFRTYFSWKDATIVFRSQEYTLTESNKHCANSAPYVENPEIIEYTKKGILVSHEIVLLTDINTGMLYSLIIIILCFAIIPICSFSLAAGIADANRSDNFKYSDIQKITRLQGRRKMHYNLEAAAKRCKSPIGNISLNIKLDFFDTSTDEISFMKIRK